MFRRTGELTILLSRSAFLVLIVLAAAAYGLTRDSTILAFNWAMGGTFVAWSFGHLICLRAPRIGWLPLLACSAILVFGWSCFGLAFLADWMADRDAPQWIYDFAAEYGVYYPDLTLPALARTTVLLGAFVIAFDLFSDPRWGRALMLTLAGTAIGMVLVFFLQKITGNALTLISVNEKTRLAFVTYRYWGNGAAFLNLLWPLVAAIAVHSALLRTRGWSFWMCAAILVFSALYINVSKAGHLLGVIGLVVFSSITAVSLIRSGRLSSRIFSLRYASLLAAMTLVLGFTLFSAISWERWDRLLAQDVDKNVRIAAYDHFLKIVPEAGWAGFGPGSFQYVYLPYVREDRHVRRTPFWVAHQDYLQTVIEWGYVGSALWAILLVPGASRTLVRSFRHDPAPENLTSLSYAYTFGEKLKLFFTSLPSPSEPIVQAGAFTAILLTGLHALVDFPMQIESLQFYFLIWIALGWATFGHLRRTGQPPMP